VNNGMVGLIQTRPKAQANLT